MAETAILERTAVVRHGRRLEYFTIGWNTLEGLIAVIAGAVAGSVSLIGFGIDSFIEQRALQVVGICFLCLAAYIAYESATDLWFKRAPEHSIPGIVLACVSLVVMPLLSFGLWWADPVVGLIMVPIIAKEGVDGLQGKACEDCCAR